MPIAVSISQGAPFLPLMSKREPSYWFLPSFIGNWPVIIFLYSAVSLPVFAMMRETI